MTAPSAVLRSRLLISDVFSLAATGLRVRPIRAILSALGIAIGVAAMVSVVGISSSSQARLTAQIAALGTDLLTADTGRDLFGGTVPLAENTVSKVTRIPGVHTVSSTADLPDLRVYRSSLIDPARSGGIVVSVAESKLLDAVGGTVRTGSWFNEATASYPTAVLGSKAAQRLGVVSPGSNIWLGNTYVTVIGILNPVILAPELDSRALIGEQNARASYGYLGYPTRIYERSDPERVADIRRVLAPTINPQQPNTVQISRPSDALEAQNIADQAFTGLLVAVGSIALLVGGIGVANTMVISVVERRREIGLRRALGATKGHIRDQFLAEALLLSGLGGVLGAALGYAVTALIALLNNWPTSVPPLVLAAGVAVTVLIGAVAGLYPALRAARIPPTAALA